MVEHDEDKENKSDLLLHYSLHKACHDVELMLAAEVLRFEIYYAD